MENVFPNNAYHMPVYRKALEIFKISRALATHFSDNRHVFEMDISSTPKHRFAGLLVTESLQLAPGIASAASTGSSEKRLKKLQRIRKVAKSLRSQCKKLEFSGVKEVEFLDLLRKEIGHFEQLMNQWLQNIQNPR